MGLLITQFQAGLDYDFAKKIATGGTTVRFLTVNGGQGFWIAGDPHTFSYRSSGITIQRLAVEPDGDDGFRYSLLVVRGGSPKDEFVGKLVLQATVAGGEGGARVVHLPDDQPDSATALLLKFKYYQRVEGRFRVPPGARVTSVAVRAYEAGQEVPRATRSLNLG